MPSPDSENIVHYQPTPEKTPIPAKYSGPIGRLRFGLDYTGRVIKLLLQTVRAGYEDK